LAFFPTSVVRLAKVKRKVKDFSNNSSAITKDMELDALQRWCEKSQS
jgi:hypothetical protein